MEHLPYTSLEEMSHVQPSSGSAGEHGYTTVNGSPAQDDNHQDHEEGTDTCRRRSNPSESYGWFSWRPGYLQCLNNPKGMLFILCVYVFGQGMTVNGMVYAVITSLERRFNLVSVQSGLISSIYDFFMMIFVLFVTYFGERAHKPRLIGIGALVFSCGSIVFTLPQYLSGPYRPGAAEFDMCDFNRTEANICDADSDGGSGQDSDLSNFYPVFIFAQGLHALGASALYTLGITYIDENSPPGSAAFHTAIFFTVATLGPAAGFLLGSRFLDIYTDLTADQNTISITPDSPVWVGAWWLGFIVSAGICLAVSFPLLGFNKHLPSYDVAQKQRYCETQTGAEYQSKTTSFGTNKLSDFPRAVLSLLRNPTYLFVDLASTCESFQLAFIAAFGPKLIESLFNLSTGSASLIIGIVLLPSGIIGSILGGYIVKRFDLKVSQIFRYLLVINSMGALCIFGFLMTCPNVPFAGVTVQYENTTHPHSGDTNLLASCNANCTCDGVFDSICGSNGVMYYSSCHAGCIGEVNVDGVTQYVDCSCIPGSDADNSELHGTSVSDRCEQKCPVKIPWLICLFGTLMFVFMALVPSITVTIRCVDYSQRSFALGLQTLMNKSLGLVPGPIAFGALVDKSCLLWENECDGSQNCWIYDNWQLAIYTFIMALGCRIGTLAFYSLAYISYTPSTYGDTEDEKMGVEFDKLKSRIDVNQQVKNPDD